MPKPVPIPSGPLAVTDSDVTRAEELVAALAQVFNAGTSGGTLNTEPFLVPDQSDPMVDPAAVDPVPFRLDTAAKQLYYRQLAHALASWVGGGGSSSPEPSTFSATGSVSVGDAVYISGSNAVGKADATVDTKMPVVGVVLSVVGSVVTVQTRGALAVFSGLTPGNPYFVGTNGAVTDSIPVPGSVGSGSWQAQALGVALNSTTLLLGIAVDVVQYDL